MSEKALHAHRPPLWKTQDGAARAYGLVLSGGGARGFVHVGVLRALEHLGLSPAAVVGVSMGAVVGSTYSLNRNWYKALVDMDISGFPALPDISSGNLGQKLYNLYRAEQFVSSSWYGWGIGQATHQWGLGILRSLTHEKNLEDGRIPIYVSATDLMTGERVAFSQGCAWERVYASSALAGLLPPAEIDGHLLVDGGYSDIAPVDLARDLIDGPVIAIDASRNSYSDAPKNGLQAMLRSLEICQNEHAALRFATADLVLQPALDSFVGTLDFARKRQATCAGIAMVLSQKTALSELLDARTDPPREARKMAE